MFAYSPAIFCVKRILRKGTARGNIRCTLAEFGVDLILTQFIPVFLRTG